MSWSYVFILGVFAICNLHSLHHATNQIKCFITNKNKFFPLKCVFGAMVICFSCCLLLLSPILFILKCFRNAATHAYINSQNGSCLELLVVFVVWKLSENQSEIAVNIIQTLANTHTHARIFYITYTWVLLVERI